MDDIFKTDKELKEAIGAFVIAFSELEFGLALLGTLTESDVSKSNSYLLKHMGNSFKEKTKVIDEYIKEDLNELQEIWQDIKVEIGQLNRERRFIVHGFIQYALPKENVKTYIKESKKLIEQTHTPDSLKKLTTRLHYLNTGEQGINGNFWVAFRLARINKWNKEVEKVKR